MLHQNTIEKIGLQKGFVTFLLLGSYFLVMKATGLVHMIEFRLLNVFIMFYGCYTAVKIAKANLEDFNFLKGYGAGLLTALTASILFTFFGLLYIELINPSFINEIRSEGMLGIYQNKYIAVGQIFIEGAASGILLTHISVMRFKKTISEDLQESKVYNQE